MTANHGAPTPLDLLALLVDRVAAADVPGVLRTYAADAVVSLPRGREAAGPAAIRAAYEAVFSAGSRIGVEAGDATAPRVIETGQLAMVSFTGADGVVRTLVAWRDSGVWAWVRDGSMLRDVEAALATGGLDAVA